MASNPPQPSKLLRTVADWVSRAVFATTVVVEWATLGLPWKHDQTPTGLLYSGLVLVAAFIFAALAVSVREVGNTHAACN